MDRRDVIRALALGGGAVTIDGRALGTEPRVYTSGVSLENDRVLVAVGMNGAGPFIFMIDTRQRKLWVQPSRQTVPPTRYGLSGLWLDHEGDRISVAAVGAASPAAATGLKVGDRIMGEAFPALLCKIGGGPGTEIGLKIERDGVASSVRFTLRPYL